MISVYNINMLNTKIEFTPFIQNLVIDIANEISNIERMPSQLPSVSLRKQNQVRTIFSTTKIEGNTLNFDEVTAIIEGRKIKGDKKEINEIKNTFKIYDQINDFDPYSFHDYLLCHNILMKNLIKTNGKIRKVNVGIQSKGKIKSVFPEFEKVESLCRDFFEYISNSKDNYIVKSCMIHYLSVSIHPFEDGNGRISRFWQRLFLSKNYEIFKYLPIESFIRSNEEKYYESLSKSQKANNPTRFIEMSLKCILEALIEAKGYQYEVTTTAQERRFQKAKNIFENHTFTRKDYLKIFPSLSESSATKDLTKLVQNGTLDKSGIRSSTVYKFI